MLKQFKALVLASATLLALQACDKFGGVSEKSVTENGLSYKIIKDADDSVAVVGNILALHITVRNDGDSLINSSRTNGGSPVLVTVATPNRSLDLMAGLLKLSAGDSAVFYMPSDSLYGNMEPSRRPPMFPKGSNVCYHIKVLNRYTNRQAIISKQLNDLKAWAASKDLEVQTDESGVLYAISSKVSSKAALEGDSVAIKYKGYRLDGQVFDESGARGPYGIVLGAHTVIPGWERGLLHFGEGDKGYLLINSDLGYGDQGIDPTTIPGFTPLIFEVEMAKNYGPKGAR